MMVRPTGNPILYESFISPLCMRYKLAYLFLSAIFFSLVYSFMKSTHFHGLNKIQDKIQDALVQKVVEPFYSHYSEEIDSKPNVKKDVTENVIKEKTKIIQPNWGQRYLDSLYFSVITSCLLGYGDIYPITNTSKILVSIQGLITLMLILS